MSSSSRDHRIFFPLFLWFLLCIRYRSNDRRSSYLGCVISIGGCSLRWVRRIGRGRCILIGFLNALVTQGTCLCRSVAFCIVIICFTIIVVGLASKRRFGVYWKIFIGIFIFYRRRFLFSWGILQDGSKSLWRYALTTLSLWFSQQGLWNIFNWKHKAWVPP